MRNQKGFATIFILVVILIITAVAGGAYYFGTKKAPVSQSPNPIVTSTPQPVVSQPSSPTDETANWKTYTDKDHGFSFKYSSALKIPNGYPFFKVIDTNSSEDDPGAKFIILSISSPSDDGYSIRAKDYQKFSQIKIGATLKTDEGNITHTSDINVDGVSANVFSYIITRGLSPAPSDYRVIFMKNNIWYEFEIGPGAPPPEFINYMNQILSTFKFTQ